MTEERDPLLQNLFAEVQQDLDGEVFVSQVMARTQGFKLRILIGIIAVALMTSLAAWLFSIPLLEITAAITQLAGIELIPISHSTIAWLVAPINNIATLLVIIAKLMKNGWNRTMQASYVN